MFGISHTRHTLVGDAFIRGISGGERKRVSIAEILASKSSVVGWDNSTRGVSGLIADLIIILTLGSWMLRPPSTTPDLSES